MFLPRLIHQIWQDIQWLGKWYKQEADAVNVGRLILTCIAGLVAITGLYLFWTTPVNIPLSVFILLLTVAAYLSVAWWRIRVPELDIGELTADDLGPSCCFHIRVKNKRPWEC